MPGRNIARCAKCGDIIESLSRHHFITCKCGEISLDGGRCYLRALATDLSNIIYLTDEEAAAHDKAQPRSKAHRKTGVVHDRDGSSI